MDMDMNVCDQICGDSAPTNLQAFVLENEMEMKTLINFQIT